MVWWMNPNGFGNPLVFFPCHPCSLCKTAIKFGACHLQKFRINCMSTLGVKMYLIRPFDYSEVKVMSLTQ